jgi:hypothetical protein
VSENQKTRRVAGVDLSASHFAFVGDVEDPATWKIALHFPGDHLKTVNAVKSALFRFDSSQGIPVGQRRAVWNRIVGAAIALGIKSQRDKVVAVTDQEAALLLAEIAAHRFLEKVEMT